ncbi:putative methyltransferase PMT21 [Hibiscus syriacus]|uniref:Methyltransferase n=1 Tax=Hibiscus syriacus TaxID=106335 RepID=A0A6A3CKY3_HIBSY|nr:putative methyltransferase PMT21 [Hibiscus syriacus]
MNQKDERNQPQPDKGFKIVPATLLVFTLCGLSFYLGGIFNSENNIFEGKIVQELSKAVSSPKESAVKPLQIKSVSFPECSIDYQDYTPCTDPRRWKKYSYRRLTFLERHFPPLFERTECLVPSPNGYKPPIRWPKSRDECGGTMFPKGVGAYVNLMQDLIPEMRDGTIRTAIDTGCGVASWGGDLLDRGILTISLAPRDNHEAQVQFALERGIPAILGIISTQRLPFPSSSFDMAHCSRCLIPWTEFGGIYLLEVHRILRPGGFWVLSGPPINYEHRYLGWNTTEKEQRAVYEKMQDLPSSMCFTVYAKQDDIAVWQKSSDNSCYEKLASPDLYPAKCDDSIEPDSAWYTPLRPCVVAPRPKLKRTSLDSLPKWPERLKAAPECMSDVPGRSGTALKQDDSKWRVRAEHYKKLLPALGTDQIRNVMDMNTVFGGLAAALIDYPLWVMNVVSSYAANTLPVIFDRGLIGTYHDWCEAFSTYPRTYDFLHVDGLFTAESHRCEMKYALLEMDRILRPEGHILMRESSYFIDAIDAVAKAVRWNCRKEDTEDGGEKEKILVCQKTLWYSSNNNSTR